MKQILQFRNKYRCLHEQVHTCILEAAILVINTNTFEIIKWYFLIKNSQLNQDIYLTFLFTQDIHLSMVSSFDGKVKRYTSVQPSIYIRRAKACPEILFFIGFISPADKKKSRREILL